MLLPAHKVQKVPDFLGVWKIFLFVLSGVRAAVCSGSCSGPNLLLFIAYWQQPRRQRAMCKKSQIYFGLNLVIFQKTSMNVFDQERGCLHPRISNLLLFSAWWQEPCNRQTICKKASNLMVSFWLFSKLPIQIFLTEFGCLHPRISNLLLFSACLQRPCHRHRSKSSRFVSFWAIKKSVSFFSLIFVGLYGPNLLFWQFWLHHLTKVPDSFQFWKCRRPNLKATKFESS